jgi:hypothetical protein
MGSLKASQSNRKSRARFGKGKQSNLRVRGNICRVSTRRRETTLKVR